MWASSSSLIHTRIGLIWRVAVGEAWCQALPVPTEHARELGSLARISKPGIDTRGRGGGSIKNKANKKNCCENCQHAEPQRDFFLRQAADRTEPKRERSRPIFGGFWTGNVVEYVSLCVTIFGECFTWPVFVTFPHKATSPTVYVRSRRCCQKACSLAGSVEVSNPKIVPKNHCIRKCICKQVWTQNKTMTKLLTSQTFTSKPLVSCALHTQLCVVPSLTPDIFPIKKGL